MALKSTTLALEAGNRSASEQRKTQLLERHNGAIKKVLTDAQAFKEERKATLDTISDVQLRESAER
jgi:hypothetical protein